MDRRNGAFSTQNFRFFRIDLPENLFFEVSSGSRGLEYISSLDLLEMYVGYTTVDSPCRLGLTSLTCIIDHLHQFNCRFNDDLSDDVPWVSTLTFRFENHYNFSLRFVAERSHRLMIHCCNSMCRKHRNLVTLGDNIDCNFYATALQFHTGSLSQNGQSGF